MGLFDRFAGTADRFTASVANAANYRGNKDVLEGKVAAMMLTAYADNNCSVKEEQEAIDTLSADKQVEAAGFTQMDIAATWERLKVFRPERPTGKIQLRRELKEAIERARKTGNPQIAEDILLGAANVAFSDDDVSEAEKSELKQIEAICGVKLETLGIIL